MSEKPRLKPWYVDEIVKLKCERVGCNNNATHQWNVCADKHRGKTRYRRLCITCDVELNRLSMNFVFGDTEEVREKMATYEAVGVFEA